MTENNVLWIFGVITLIIICAVAYFRLRKSGIKPRSARLKSKIYKKNKEFFDTSFKVMGSDGSCEISIPDRPLKQHEDWWFDSWEELSRKAEKSAIDRRSKLMDAGRYLEYYPGAVVYERPELEGNILVMSDCFTNLFPSTHDMDDWAIGTMTTDIFLFKGYADSSIAKRSILYIKKHFVNHGLVRGMIWFDLYIPKDPSLDLVQQIKKNHVPELLVV